MSGIVSITGQSKSPDYTYEYVNNAWKTIRSDDNIQIAVSKSKTDGILFHCTTRIGSPPASILKWILLQDDVPTGIESITSKRDTLQSWKVGELVLRRYIVKSGSIRSSNRQFTVLTSVSKSSDGVITISSRSVDIPKDLAEAGRKAQTRGCIKAIMFASGYLIKPMPDGHGSTLHFATHLDMLGSANSKMNATKAEDLIGNMIARFEKYARRSPPPSASLLTISPLTPLKHGPKAISTEAELKEQARLRARCTLQTIRELHHLQILSGKLNMRITEGSYRALNSDLDAHVGQKKPKWKLTKQFTRNKIKNGDLSGAVPTPEELDSEMEVLYQRDGISICEHVDKQHTVGVLSAYCHVEAPMAVVRAVIMNGRGILDGMLAAKSVLYAIEPKTRIQWQAYKAPNPLGSRDAVFASTEEAFHAGKGTKSQGFVQAWTSIDDLYEQSAELTSKIEGLIKKSNTGSQDSEFIRTTMRLGGFVVVPTASGGCDISLFMDADVWSDIPTWMVAILAQFTLYEAMRELQFSAAASYTSTGAVTTHPRLRLNQIDRVLNQTARREQRACEARNGPTAECAYIGLQEVSPCKEVAVEALVAIDDLDRREGEIDVADGHEGDGSISHRSTYDPLYSIPSSYKDGQPTLACDIAKEAVRVFMRYVDLGRMTEAKRAMGFNWLLRVQKNNIEVETSAVNSSDWIALRGTCYVQAEKQTILNLLTTNARSGEYDDMYDFQEHIRMLDDRTELRRIAFKGIWPTSPRDFVVATTSTEFSNGSALVVSRSLEDPAMGEKPGYVRGTLYTSGFLIQPTEIIPNDPLAKQLAPNGCKITLCAHTSLGGNIPSSIINMLSTSAPLKVLANVSEVTRRDQALVSKLG